MNDLPSIGDISNALYGAQTGQVFVYSFQETGTRCVVNVHGLRSQMHKCRRDTIKADEWAAAANPGQPGGTVIDMDRVRELPTDPAKIEPVMLVEVVDPADGKTGHILCDGNHRAFALWRAGVTDIPAMIFDWSTCEPFIVFDPGKAVEQADPTP